MKKVTIINILLLLLVISFENVSFIATAQKLPKIQQTGKRAPADIKVDGKTTEWKDEFLAYNINNRIYYTLSNDDDNVYLTVRAGDGYANEKAILGISFVIKPSAEKGSKSKENIIVTFPITMEPRMIEPTRNTTAFVRRLEHDTTQSARKRIDSLRIFANKQIDDVFKEINITGIKEIDKASISIYNTEGIKVAAHFNDQMRYTYELAIPLKYLGSSINSAQKFNYSVKMDGVPEKTPGSPYPKVVISGDIVAFLGVDNAYVSYPTDFSGTYSLVKK